MENNPVIFIEVNPKLLKKVNKPIITTRVIVFTLSGLCLVPVIASIPLLNSHEEKMGIIFIISFSIMALIYLLLGLWSLTTPFIPILIAAVINVSVFICWLLLLLFTNDSGTHDIEAISTAFQLAIVFFLIRGVVYTKKLKKLMLTVN